MIRKIDMDTNMKILGSNNKKYKRNIAMFILLILGLVIYQCNDGGSNHSHHGKEHILPAGDAPEGSILELGGVWTSDAGNEFRIESLRGKLFIVSMFYGSCQSVCPRIISDVGNVAKKIEAKTGIKPVILMVTFDPKNDTVSALNQYRAKHELGENWILLTGKGDQIRILSVALGINYKQTSDGEFNHSAIISLVSKEGYIVSRLEGVGVNSDKMVEKFSSLQ